MFMKRTMLIVVLFFFLGSMSGLTKEKKPLNDIYDIGVISEIRTASEHENLGDKLPLWTIIPFIGILLSIAMIPLVKPHFWHKFFPIISLFWSLVFAVPFLVVYKDQAWYEILHIYFVDYIPFIILLWGLYTVAGGIVITGKLVGKPYLNAFIILLGTMLASWIGTTGASMLMIQPIIRTNKDRKHKVHIIVFFIFLVSNIGGSLTPVGDPPLFLGFLHHVPFFWTLKLLFPMGFISLILLIIFFIIDTIYYKKESIQPSQVKFGKPLGIHNFLFLGGIVGAVIMSGMWKIGEVNILGVHVYIQNILRDVIIVLMGLASLVWTNKENRNLNNFTWFPIKEVAYLFAGIFMTIIPAIAILRAGENGALAFLIESVKSPVHYFWITGSLSSFLDNAPTYLTFFNTALGSFFAGMPEKQAVANLISQKEIYLVAISCGAVFMGAMTYIGNAPNFMVKSIAEEAGVKMPSFFGYMFKYSIPILVPVFVIVTLIFL